jgi:hypothetical protein
VLRSNSLSWKTELPDGIAWLSLRPENIRLAGSAAAGAGDSVTFRGKVGHQAFHGATELLEIKCLDGMVLSVRAASRADWRGELEFEFHPGDAVPVRASGERP